MIKSIIGVCFDCSNANELADFYVKRHWRRNMERGKRVLSFTIQPL
jgi:hypothetical protein